MIATIEAERINFAVGFRCDFPMYYSHSEIMIHSEIDSLRLMQFWRTAPAASCSCWQKGHVAARRWACFHAARRHPGFARLCLNTLCLNRTHRSMDAEQSYVFDVNGVRRPSPVIAHAPSPRAPPDGGTRR